MTKSELRQYIRNKKREYSDKQLQQLSQPITEKVLSHPRVKEAETVIAYYSLPDEVNTHQLVDELVSMGKTVLLPKVVSDTEMTLHKYRYAADLTPGYYGIMEPNTESLTINHEPLTVLVPGMAFDKAGHRLGRGKGYYDRLLSPLSSHPSALSYKIGLCFPFQKFEEVPHDEHDIKMDEVL